jgi:hypothetical protein
MKVNWELSKKMFVAKSVLRKAEVAVREKATFWFRIRYRQRELKNESRSKATIKAEATATQRQQRIISTSLLIQNVRRKPSLVGIDDAGCVAQSRAGHWNSRAITCDLPGALR